MKRNSIFLLLIIICLCLGCKKKETYLNNNLEGVFLSLYPEMTEKEYDSATIEEKERGNLSGTTGVNSASWFSFNVAKETGLNFQLKKERRSIRLYEWLRKIYSPEAIIDSLLNLYKLKYNDKGSLFLPIYSHLDSTDNIYVYNDTVNDIKYKYPFKTFQLSSYGYDKSKYHVFKNDKVTVLIGYKIRKAFKDIGDLVNTKGSKGYNEKMKDLDIDIDYFRNSSFDSLVDNIEIHFENAKREYEESILESINKNKTHDSILDSNRNKI